MSKRWRLWVMNILVLFYALVSVGNENTIRIYEQDISDIRRIFEIEKNLFEFDQLNGNFQPSNPMKYLGVQSREFKLNPGSLSRWAGFRFNHLKSHISKIELKRPKNIQFTMHVENQEDAIITDLGSISTKDLEIEFEVTLDDQTTHPLLSATAVRIKGSTFGSGVFRSTLLQGALRKALVAALYNQLEEFLKNVEVQNSIYKKLLKIAHFKSGNEPESIVPGSFQVSTSKIGLRELRYQVISKEFE